MIGPHDHDHDDDDDDDDDEPQSPEVAELFALVGSLDEAKARVHLSNALTQLRSVNPKLATQGLAFFVQLVEQTLVELGASTEARLWVCAKLVEFTAPPRPA